MNSTGTSGILGYSQDHVSLNFSGKVNQRGVFNKNILQPIIGMTSSELTPNPASIMGGKSLYKNEPIKMSDKSVTQIEREKHKDFLEKHQSGLSKALVSRQVIDDSRDHINVTINTVNTSKQGSIFY